MSGRLEKDNLIEEKIRSIVKEQPIVIKTYTKSFGSKTINTKRAYIGHAINFCNYIKKEFNIDMEKIEDIEKINYSHITSYMDYIKKYISNGNRKNKEAGTCAMEFYAIKHFCKYLKLCGYIKRNPCDDVEVPKDKKEHEIISLSPEEIQIIKDNIINGVGTRDAKAKQYKWRSRDMCIIFLGITTGLRVSAMSNIDMSDINITEKTIKTIEKGNNEKIVYLPDKMIELLVEWMGDREKLMDSHICDALFISSRRTRISTQAIREMIEKYTYNINKNITPHKLRSTAATNLYDKTDDIYLVADVLGHRNIQNTKRYAKVSNEKRRLAAETLSELM